MVAKAACPDRMQLQCMLDGSLPPTDQMQVSLHLEDCRQCQTVFERLAVDTKLLPDREFRSDGPPEAALLHVMEQLAAAGPDAVDDEPSQDELYTPFLQPSDNPEHLGRLGPYEVIRLIGQGGMGMVFQAHDPRLNRFVAIKVLAPQLAANARARKRFMREAQAAAAINHDHIVTLHAVDEVDGFPYIVMEYVLGISLAERIGNRGPLALKDCVRIASQIAVGLAAAHAQGLIHRDIKPANILLENGTEKVKITDFGLARAVNEVQVTQTGQIAGTPDYMSPEQARGQSLDHRTDLFSLGCVMYAMCAGQSPFHAAIAWDSIARVCNERPHPLGEICPEAPRWLVDAIERLLAKNPDDRPQSAADVAEQLSRHLAALQQSTVVLERKPPIRARRTIRRWVVAIALLLAFGAIGGAVTMIRVSRPEGILEITVDDPSVKVAIDGDELRIQGAGTTEVRLQLGEHRLQATKDGKPVYQELVTINRDGKQVVKIGMAPPQSAPDGPRTAEQRAVRDAAKRLLTAIRTSDDATLQAMTSGLETEQWREAIPIFAKEIRGKLERLWHSTERLDQIDEVFVQGDFAAVKAARPKTADGACLMLFFALTPDGWRNFSFRAAPPDASPEKMLADERGHVEAALKKRATAFVKLLSKGKFAEAVAQFDSVMRKALPEAKMAETLRQLNEAGGKFLGQDPPRVERIAEFFGVYVPCRWEKNRLDIKVVFNLAGQVSGLWTLPPSPVSAESPKGTLQPIKAFDITAKPISQDGLVVDHDAWRIEAKENRTVRLFEVVAPCGDNCEILYRAKIKTERLDGRAYLEMWCRLPDGNEYFSRDLGNPVAGTNDWTSYQTPFFLKPGQRPDLVKLNVVIEGKGTLWIKGVELLKTSKQPADQP